MAQLPAKLIRDERVIAIFQDFAGTSSAHDLANLAYTVIHNIANLRDHLRRWAGRHGHNKVRIDTVFRGSDPLKTVQDLSNNDKHGYPPRNGGYSGVAPRLTDLRREMRLSTQPQEGSTVVMTLDSRGEPKISGDGTGRAVITAEVVDRHGARLGDLFEIEQQAARA